MVNEIKAYFTPERMKRLFELTSALLVITGMILLSFKNPWGWYIGVVSQFSWIGYGLWTKQYFLTLQSVVLQIINFIAIYNWR